MVGAFTPINLTGATLLFTAKLNKSNLDTAGAPNTITFNWTETSTPTLGQTNGLVLPNTVATGMGVFSTSPVQNGYYYQIWGSGLTGLPALYPLQEGVITVTQSVSTWAS